ncbi:MAG: hypothetical protein AAB368_09570 [bacterium]
MRRTQILIEEHQYQALKAWARGTDRSLSDVVRLAVGRLLGERSSVGRKYRVEHLCGIVRDPGGLPARDHDRVLYGGSGLRERSTLRSAAERAPARHGKR